MGSGRPLIATSRMEEEDARADRDIRLTPFFTAGPRRRRPRQDHPGHPRHPLPRIRPAGCGGQHRRAAGRLLDQGRLLGGRYGVAGERRVPTPTVRDECIEGPSEERISPGRRRLCVWSDLHTSLPRLWEDGSF